MYRAQPPATAGHGSNRLLRAGISTAAAALVVGTAGLWMPSPAAAAGNGAASAAPGSTTSTAPALSGCTVQSTAVSPAPQPSAQPWQDTYADPQQLAGTSGTLNGKGVKVAIIDTGLAGSNTQVAHNGNVVGGGLFSGLTGSYLTDVDGHGTMVASIIAARQSTHNGMQGIAPGVSLLIYREAGCDAPGTGPSETDMADAINQAVRDGADIINISQDGYQPDPALRAAVMNAYQHNVLIVVSAGNYGDSIPSASSTINAPDPATYPASYAPYVLTVGAADQAGQVPAWSETGPYIGVTAPGVNIEALFPSGSLEIYSGTSFAAPFVTGLAALVLQEHPGLPPKTLMRVLESTASGGGAWNAAAGWGEVDPAAAIAANPAQLKILAGTGPNHDAAANAVPASIAPGMLPIVAPPRNPVVSNQHTAAYLALGATGAAVIMAGAGSVLLTEIRRRRRGEASRSRQRTSRA